MDALQEEVHALRSQVMRRPLHVIFDGPPSHESGRFVEVETPEGRSVGVGDWVERPDGLWALIIPNVAYKSP